MDELDLNLFSAWNRIAPHVKRDRAQAARRAGRRESGLFAFTPRASCLCLRATDTRYDRHAVVLPLADETIGLDDDVLDLLRDGRPHRLILNGEGIRELTKPVELPWPGVHHRIAARTLGITTRMLHRWVKRGALEHRRDEAAVHSQRGKRVPVVWANHSIDPNAHEGKPPHRIWGSLWQWMHKKIPLHYELEVERVPRMRPVNGEAKRRGWNFICPGRYFRDDAGGVQLKPCGRAAERLFFPVPLWTIPQATGERMELQIDEHGERWSPGYDDPNAGLRSFACKHCWRVRSLTLTTPDGWNEFITHLTGGLLFGHEVARPTDVAPYARKHRFTPRPRNESIELRERIVPLLLQGKTYQEIADALGVTRGSVNHHVHIIYRDEGASSREQLRRMLQPR